MLDWRLFSVALRFLRHLDTKSNGEYLRSLFEGPYMHTYVTHCKQLIQQSTFLPVAEHEEVQRQLNNMSAENKFTFQVKRKLFFLILDWHLYIKIECTIKAILFHTNKCVYQDTKGKRDRPNQVTPQSESVLRKDSDPEQIGGIGYTKTEVYHTRYNNDNSQEFGNQRTVIVAGARGNSRLSGRCKDWDKCFNWQGIWTHFPGMQEAKAELKTTRIQGDDDEVQTSEQGFHLQLEKRSHCGIKFLLYALERYKTMMENDVFANVRRHSEQPESINDTYVLEKDDSNVIPDSSNICTNDNQVDQNATECVDERAALANLIANLTLDTEENKTVLKQLKKANASLTQELKECKTNLDESSRALGEATSSRDSSLIALQTKQTELEKYTCLMT
ncbi:hypothetical protein Tco_1419602 [Tanacetum coccineum]